MKSWQTKDGQTIIMVTAGTVNTYLISYAQRFLLVDAGYPLNWRVLKNHLDRFQVKPDSLAALILTHTHFDHAGNAKRIKDQYAAPLVVQRNEAEYIRRGETLTIHGTNTFVEFFMRGVVHLFRYYHYSPVQADILVDECYDLTNWGFHGYLLHTPGHSPGSLCVIVNGEIALVGDTVFNISPRSTFPPIAAEQRLIQASWKKLHDTGCQLFLPAHGGPISRERLVKDFEKINKSL
jgi:hydroxyacylglutathione hydrolase